MRLEHQIHPNLSTVYHFLSSLVSGQECKSRDLNATYLFILTLSGHLSSAALMYFGIMLYIVLRILNEIRPVLFYVIAAILFVLSQLDYFLLSKIICRVRDGSRIMRGILLIGRYLQGSSMKVDGSFIATILETACVVTLYFAWRGITEGNVICPLFRRCSYKLQRTGITSSTSNHDIHEWTDVVFTLFPLLYTRYMLLFGLHASPCIPSMYGHLLLHGVSAGAGREALGG